MHIEWIKIFSYFYEFKCRCSAWFILGYCPIWNKTFLSYFVCNQKISIDIINKRIVLYDYGRIDKPNKPSSVALDKAGASLGQRAAQAWCLIRYFPLILGDLINTAEQQNKFNVILALLNCMDIILSEKVTLAMTYHLKYLIMEHHTLFKAEFTAPR